MSTGATRWSEYSHNYSEHGNCPMQVLFWLKKLLLGLIMHKLYAVSVIEERVVIMMM